MTFDNSDYFLLSREWRAVRMRVLERDGAKCGCCGSTAADGARMNVDHIKPRIRYPELALTESNLQVLCDACNQGKGNRYETDWRRESPACRVLPAQPSRQGSDTYECTPEERERLRQLDEVRGLRR